MGLLDWLSDSLGGMGGSGSDPFVSATAGYNGPGGDMPSGPPPAPPAPSPPVAPPPMQDPSAMGGQPPVPMPMPRPPGADGGAPPLPPPINVPAPPGAAAAAPDGMTSPQMLPPNAMPTQGDMGGGGRFGLPSDNPASSTAKTMIGRALGLDGNTESQLRGSLGAGFKAAGNSAGKSPFQAFSSGAGESIEGGKGADDKTADQQGKYLDRQMKANQASVTDNLNMARTKLALAQAEQAGTKDKASVVNSQQQLYLRADSNALKQAGVSANGVKQALTAAGGDINDPTYKKALADHNTLVDTIRTQKLEALGLSAKDAAKIGKMEGMGPTNPVPKEGLTQEKYDKLPVGAYFINPKNGALRIKQPPQAAPTGATAATPAQSGGLPPLPPPITAPAGSAADSLE